MDSNICRVCLDKAATISLFDKQEDVPYCTKIMKCVNVRIEEGDGLPDTICEGCASDLAVSYDFLQKCEASDKALRCLDLLQSTPEVDVPADAKVEIKIENPDIDIGRDYDSYTDDHYSDDLVKNELENTPDTKVPDNMELVADKIVQKKNKYRRLVPDHLRKARPRVKSGPLQCIQCGRVLSCFSAYETHMRTHTKEKPFRCDICSKQFSNKYTLKMHINRHYGIKHEKSNKELSIFDGRKNKQKMSPILCVVCGISASSRSAMELHMRTHTGERPFECGECKKTFSLKGSLKRHMFSHNQHTAHCKYICEHCGKKFTTKNGIIVHLRVHTGEKPYACPYCPGRFCQLSSLIRHKRRHTGDKPFSCQICGKHFLDKSILNKHQSVHTTEKKFVCHICNKSFKSKASLKVHIECHTNTTRCVCNFCGMSFTLKGNLTLHIRRKHSETSGFCTICNKTLTDIELHLRVHKGEKPFVCKICDQAYTTKNGLSHHMNFRHRDASKFKCTTGDCNKSFPKISMLEFHVLKQHLDSTPYICHHCDRGFLRPSDLSRHLKVNHLDTHTQVKSQFIKTIKHD